MVTSPSSATPQPWRLRDTSREQPVCSVRGWGSTGSDGVQLTSVCSTNLQYTAETWGTQGRQIQLLCHSCCQHTHDCSTIQLVSTSLELTQ